jgi:hypothetical protein
MTRGQSPHPIVGIGLILEMLGKTACGMWREFEGPVTFFAERSL